MSVDEDDEPICTRLTDFGKYMGDCRAMDIAVISEPGGHLINDDAYLYDVHPEDESCWICCVADGQGGRSGGARGAQLACESVIQAARLTPVDKLVDGHIWRAILENADLAVAADPASGFSTLVGFCIAQGQICGAPNGDSALLVMYDSDATILTQRQQKNPPVGSGSAFIVEFAANLSSQCRLLVLTDGVWKYVGWDRIINIVRNHSGIAALEAMRELARLPVSGTLQDDFTAVLVTEI